MGLQLKKRRPANALTPEEMLATLADLQLQAVLLRHSLWLSVDPLMADLLNNCCTGQQDGGPDTADEVILLLRGVEPRMSRTTAATTAPISEAEDQRAPITENCEVPRPIMAEIRCLDSEASCSGRDESARTNTSICSISKNSVPCGHNTSFGSRTHVEENLDLARGPVIGVSAVKTQGPTPESTNASHDKELEPAGIPRSTPESAPGSTLSAAHAQQQQNNHRRHGRRGPPAHLVGHSYPAGRRVAVRLTLEEAFFLAHVLQCLSVYEPLADEGCRVVDATSGVPVPVSYPDVDMMSESPDALPRLRVLGTLELWRRFSGIRANFPTSYAAYHHLKAKGWLPRSGLLYGVDFVLYQLHPAASHSNYGVLVLPQVSAGPSRVDLTWLDLQVTNRLINQVSKRLLLLFVHVAPDAVLDDPKCLVRMAVEERLVSRWVPDAHREDGPAN